MILVILIISSFINFSNELFVVLTSIPAIIVIYSLIKRIYLSGYDAIKTFRLYTLPKTIIVPIILLGIGLAIASGPSRFFGQYVLNTLLHIKPSSTPFLKSTQLWETILIFISAVIIFPPIEELVFRGLIMSSLEKSFGVWKAVIASSFIFGLMHLNPSDSIVIAISSLLVGWIVIKTNSILSGIVIHMIGNFIAFISSTIISKYYPNYFHSPDASFNFVTAAVITFAFAVFMLLLSVRLINKRKADNNLVVIPIFRKYMRHIEEQIKAA
jgi:membrane protease YdiL (CAAX protease family)